MTDSTARFVYVPERDQSFTNDRCFLCGAALTRANRTDEHVIPQWLQRDLDLHRETLTLLNRTTIPYAQLKIPCCQSCNGTHLSKIEETVSRAFRSGDPSAVEQLDPNLLFLWMGKIQYGLMFRELSLAADQRDPHSPMIMSDEWMSSFGMHHRLLQAARGVVSWPDTECPASIFVFRTQALAVPRANFDYVDTVRAPFFAMRIGRVGVVAVLQDWGATKQLAIPMFDLARSMTLHPRQFQQVAAMALTLLSLARFTPRHVLLGKDDHLEILTVPFVSSEANPLFEEFDVDRYAHVLAETWRVPLEQIYDGQKVANIIFSAADGAPVEIPWDGTLLEPTIHPVDKEGRVLSHP